MNRRFFLQALGAAPVVAPQAARAAIGVGHTLANEFMLSEERARWGGSNICGGFGESNPVVDDSITRGDAAAREISRLNRLGNYASIQPIEGPIHLNGVMYQPIPDEPDYEIYPIL